MKNALRENGMICCQGETHWLFSNLINKVMTFAGDIFPSVSYAQCQVPTYPTGLIGFVMCSLEANKQFAQPTHKFDEETVCKLELKFYNSEMHTAAFANPTSFQQVLVFLFLIQII
jgi:spermidine synthase